MMLFLRYEKGEPEARRDDFDGDALKTLPWSYPA
jgi:hypothetical protein